MIEHYIKFDYEGKIIQVSIKGEQDIDLAGKIIMNSYYKGDIPRDFAYRALNTLKIIEEDFSS